MAQEQDPPALPPGPDPALKRLERFVGTWQITGRTLDATQDSGSGQTTFEWLPGGFFPQQRSQLNFAGYQVQGLEVIGYDRPVPLHRLRHHGPGSRSPPSMTCAATR